MNTLTRYYLKSKLSGEIHTKEYYLKQVEEAGLSKLFDVFNYDIIKRVTWTQLTDKNGAKIFEGDKLIISEVEGVVKYSDGSFHLITEDDNSGRNPILQERTKRFEIIGNIHEGDK